MLLKKNLFLSEFLCKIKVHDKVSGCIRFYCPDTPGNTVRIIRNTQFGVGNNITVNTTINRTYDTAQKGFTKYFEIKVDNDEAGVLGITKIPILNIDIDRQVSHMTGGLTKWSVSNPGSIVMYKER
jgi:hypothetical protein